MAATLRCIRALGIRIVRFPKAKGNGNERQITILGTGPYGFNEPANILNAANSGTTIRLLTSLLAPQPFLSIITGDNSLRSRPMGRIVEPLIMMGAHITGRAKNTKAPLVMQGKNLHGIDYAMPVASAQLKSAVLLAGLFAEGKTTVYEPVSSRDHTERMLKAMGANIMVDGLSITVRRSELSPLDLSVPGDISSAAFWVVAACCHPNAEVRIEDVGVNPTRAGILDILREMGAQITLENVREEGGEPMADIVARSSSLEGTQIQGEMIPRIIDEVPILAVAACFARGKTVIRDAKELRIKETDRIRTVVEELSKMGAKIQELTDGMVIQGTGSLQGASCRSHGDHRLAMSLGIAGLLADGETIVEGAEAAQVSYPGFWQDLQNLVSAGRSR